MRSLVIALVLLLLITSQPVAGLAGLVPIPPNTLAPTDPDGDGTFTWTSPKLTGGSYQVRVAAHVSGTETFGAGGYPGADGESVGWFDAGPLPLTISFTPATGALGIDLPF